MRTFTWFILVAALLFAATIVFAQTDNDRFAVDVAVNGAGNPVDVNGNAETLAFVIFKTKIGNAILEKKVTYNGAPPVINASELFAGAAKGTYPVWATAVDASGNASDPSPAIQYTWDPAPDVDAVPPAAPVKVRVVK